MLRRTVQRNCLTNMATVPESHMIACPNEDLGGTYRIDESDQNRASQVGRSNGVYLTWEDLWVTAPKRNDSHRSILAGLTGFARPAEVLAIMGPSGSGKSTLLDALAGRLPSGMTQTGVILVNGQRQRLSYGTSAYVTQDDVLMTTLTVREAVYFSAELQLPESMSKAEKKQRAEAVMTEMGLLEAMDIRIGGRSTKGISGGQRRRVSICIEILSRPKLLFLDEPTSGLDSAASFHVMSRIVEQARLHGGTIVASIHQPSSEVFEFFDNLCLLASGETIYFGPASLTNEFFAASGFPCPSMRNPSDHFLRTINKNFDKEISQRGHFVSTVDTTEAINILTRSYKSSSISQELLYQVEHISNMGGRVLKKVEQVRLRSQCSVLTRRSFCNMNRDLGYYWLRFAIYIALCLSIGTIFLDIGRDYGSIQARGAMLMFITTYLTFMAIGGFPSFVEDLKIFRRERLNGHYGAAAFTIATTLSSAPFLFVISIIPSCLAYYLVGLQKSFEHVIFFAFVVYAGMLLVEGLMMIVASIVPDFLMGIITGAGIQGAMVLASGFFRLPKDLPKPVWRYPMYHIAFHKYLCQGLYKNEFIGLTFPAGPGGSAQGNGSVVPGIEVLKDYWQIEMGYSKWVDLGILFGMVVLYRFLFWAMVKLGEVKPSGGRWWGIKQKQRIQMSSNTELIDMCGS